MRTTPSLTEQRMLPRADRELFQYEIVRFHLEDLNTLAERTRARGRRALLEHERVRAAAIVQAARWDKGAFLRATKRFIEEGRAEGDDAFGPLVVLLALDAAREAYVSRVAPALRAVAEALVAAPPFASPSGRRRGTPRRHARRP